MRISAFARNVFRRGRVERDLDDELRASAAMVADERAAGGLDTQEAHRTALADMGGIETVKGHVGDRRAVPASIARRRTSASRCGFSASRRASRPLRS